MKPPSIKQPSELEPVTPEWLNQAESERFPASMEFWFPRLQQIDILNLPETSWVSLEPTKIHEGTIHELHWAECDISELRNAVETVGGPPAFIRTDQASDIYNMEDASKITSLSNKSLQSCVSGVLNFSITKAEVPITSLVVREWLDIVNYFTAWGGKKIGVEIRVFVSDGIVDGWCFDWKKSHIDSNSSDWKSKYEQTKQRANRHANEVAEMAQAVADEFSDVGTGAWSVDFVLTTDEKWYCTDMAPKRMSQKSNSIKKF